ncbi:MAG: thioredoxin [Clostridiales bacterium]|nr:thioredoxin [Clostridiales bacterium]
MEMKLNKDNFESLVLDADKPVLVDFWAPWCMPCRMIAPVVEDLAAEVEGKAFVGKVNVDEEGQLAREYGVNSIPCLVVFENGQEVRRSVGAQPKDALKKLLLGE